MVIFLGKPVNTKQIKGVKQKGNPKSPLSCMCIYSLQPQHVSNHTSSAIEKHVAYSQQTKIYINQPII